MLTEREIQFIVSAERECFGERCWDEKAIRSDVCGEYGVAVCEGGVGYAFGSRSFDEAELHRIAVLPEQRRAGAGSRLLAAFIGECRRQGVTKIFLEVRSKNVPAISMYEQSGFVRINVRRGYYGDDDGIMYILEL